MIEKAWEELSEREADILRLREQRVTLTEIATKYGISNDRVRQITVAAKGKLRDAQRKILTSEANQKLVPTEFTRSDLILIEKALRSLQEQRSRTPRKCALPCVRLSCTRPIWARVRASRTHCCVCGR